MKIKAKTIGRVVIGAAVNLGVLLAASAVLGATGVLYSAPGFAVVLAIGAALVASSAVNYVLLVSTLRQEFEDELVEDFEVEADHPRRFDETNFK